MRFAYTANKRRRLIIRDVFGTYYATFELDIRVLPSWRDKRSNASNEMYAETFTKKEMDFRAKLDFGNYTVFKHKLRRIVCKENTRNADFNDVILLLN